MKVKVSDIVVNYFESGTGAPVLFIHGFPLSSQLWNQQVQDLNKSGHILALDLRGHGKTIYSGQPVSIDQLAEDCALFLENIGIKEKVIVCGLSMGGYVTFSIYRLIKEKIAGLILTATRSDGDSPQARKNRENTILTVESQGTEPFFTSMLSKLLSPKNQNNLSITSLAREIIWNSCDRQTVINDQISLMNRRDSTPLLPDIDVPVLIIHGLDDQIVPIAEAQKMHEMIPGANMQIIAGAGHLPNLEQPEVFNMVVRNFIKSIKSKEKAHE